MCIITFFLGSVFQSILGYAFDCVVAGRIPDGTGTGLKENKKGE